MSIDDRGRFGVGTPSPAYPYGQCQVCGFSLDPVGACKDPDCSSHYDGEVTYGRETGWMPENPRWEYEDPQAELPPDPTGVDCLERYEGVDE